MKTDAFVRLAAGVAAAVLMIAGCSQEGGNTVAVKPALVQKDGVTHFEVDGKPFVMFSGELHNSTSSSESYMERIKVWDQMKEGNFNTVIASASWELVEKEEGKYDFTSVDHIIRNARKNGLKVVMIWFASWKNGNSTYAPGYVKRNPQKYPLVQTKDGGYLDVLSTFSEEALNADKKAYVALMNHIREIDPDYTVIMMQVENEMGILGSVRDFSPAAQRAWEGQVPSDLMQYLSSKKG
ncbi:MAG: beta-galactosidase, partial [Bacteroidales bacterium]|nr:beta-galactosidase [Bacteroidales bacterium]